MFNALNVDVKPIPYINKDINKDIVVGGGEAAPRKTKRFIKPFAEKDGVCPAGMNCAGGAS